jgi:hypothetical protein
MIFFNNLYQKINLRNDSGKEGGAATSQQYFNAKALKKASFLPTKG